MLFTNLFMADYASILYVSSKGQLLSLKIIISGLDLRKEQSTYDAVCSSYK